MNVIEKAITFGNEKQKNNIINEIIILEEENNDIIILMVLDKFGNYVIQKIMEYSDNITQQKIIQKILKKEKLIQNKGFSKHEIKIYSKIM